MKSLLILLSIALTVVAATQNKDNDTFVATNEWQEIKPGQSIPAGLHVRINLQTGKKEAKILDESKNDDQPGAVLSLSAAPDNGSETPPDDTAKPNIKLSKTLSDALKNLPQSGLELEYSPEKLEEIKKKYKSLKELKESYEDMRKAFKTDAEIISELMVDYKNDATESDPAVKIKARQSILEKFGYLAHQIDNAQWFIDEGGLDQVLLPLLNETHLPLRVQALRVLGALTQNNPKAQIKVFEFGFGRHLSQILITSTNSDELSAALYAFGSLLRKFPHAQQRILSTYGIQALIAVLTKECDLKLKAKAVTLISDVIVEKRFALTEKDPVVAAQYAELNFPKWLNSHDFCETLDSVVSNSLYELLDQPNEMEYFTQALESTHGICVHLWSQSPQLRHTLLTLKNRYTTSGDEYRAEVAAQIAKLIHLLHHTKESHDEL